MTSEVLAATADAGLGRRASLKSGLVQAGPLAAAGIAANAGSVLVTVVLARLLATPGYGALNQLTGLFFVVSTPGSAVLVAVVRRMTSGTAVGDARRWAGAVRRRALLALAGFTAATLAAGPFLAPALGRHDQVGVDAIVVAGGVWVFLCVDRGILQAHRAYRTLAGNLLTEGAARTVLMVVAGAAGLGVPGVALAVLVAELVAVAQARRMADRTWPAGLTLPASPEPAAGDELGRAAGDEPGNGEGWGLAGRWAGSGARDLAGAVVALAAIAVLQNVDVIVMGREGPKQAGAYAAISVSSKTIVFVAVVVAGYVLPEAAIRWRAGGHALRQLWVALALLATPAVALLAVAIAAPRWFLTVFFSARYVSAADAFLPLALAMTFLSALVVVTMYLLAVGDRWVIALVVLGAAAAAWATAAAHGVPRSTALAELSVEGALVLVASAEMLRVHRRRAT